MSFFRGVLCSILLISVSPWLHAQTEEPAETPTTTPVVDEALPTADLEVETDNALWTPSLFTGSGGTLTEFLQGGKLNWGIEFLNLKSDSDGSFETDVAGNRFSLGWETAAGTGLRGQYLTYDQEWLAINGPAATQLTSSNYDPTLLYDYLMAYENSYLLSQELDYATLDVYQRFSLGQTQLLLGVGPSYAQIDSVLQNRFDTGSPGGDYSYDYSDESLSGTGGSVVGDLKHPLVVRDSWELSFLLNGRSAYIPVDLTLRSLVISADMDDEVWIHSYGTGLELIKRFRNYSVLLRGQLEGQRWEGSIVEQEFTGTSFSMGLGW